MNLDEEIKKLKKRGPENPPSLSKATKIFSAVLDQAANQYAFRLFQDKKFRKLLGFNNLEKVEQDRIFNELIVSNLALLMLTLEAPDLRIDPKLKDYFFNFKEEIPRAHVSCLKDLGLEKRYLDDWEKLIKMRYEEYSEDKHKARQAAIKIESKEKELTADGLADIQLLLPVQTVAIGCHHHICRGKTEGKDELFKTILRSLGRFYIEIRVPIEGGEITFWKRLWVKIRHFWHKISSS